MITDQQVVLLRQKLMEGKTQQAAAASAAMSERSARKWQRGALPSERKKDGRSWKRDWTRSLRCGTDIEQCFCPTPTVS